MRRGGPGSACGCRHPPVRRYLAHGAISRPSVGRVCRTDGHRRVRRSAPRRVGPARFTLAAQAPVGRGGRRARRPLPAHRDPPVGRPVLGSRPGPRRPVVLAGRKSSRVDHRYAHTVLPRRGAVLHPPVPGGGVPSALVVGRCRCRVHRRRGRTRLVGGGDPDVQSSVATPDQVRQLVDQDFASYYSSHPAGAFAAQVWTNNAWVAALCIASGGLLGVPIPFLLWANASNVGVVGGLLAAHGKLGLFLGLILPHGLLELTAVFVAAGVGLRLGWTVVAPGDRPRAQALGQEGRAAVGVAVGLVVVLLVSGVVEAFVTPSGLPTWARIGIGLLVRGGFLAYVFVLGGRAARAGETGDIDAADAGDDLPYAPARTSRTVTAVPSP